MRKLVRFILAICVIEFGGIALCAQPVTIINATVLSPERIEPLTDAWVRLDGDRIVGMGVGSVDTTGTQVINAEGGFLIPGLIDSHVHLYHATGLRQQDTEDFEHLYGDFMAQQPRSFLYHGFTSVIELNADLESNTRFTSSPLRPNLYHCGQGVVLSDGFMALELEGAPVSEFYPGFLVDHYADGLVPEGSEARDHTPKAVVEWVRSQGGICIKLYFEEALWWPGGAPPFKLPSLALVRQVVDEAHAQGMPVLLHATTPSGHQLALDAGVDILAHGMWEWVGQEFGAPYPNKEFKEIASAISRSKVSTQPTFRSTATTASLFDSDILSDPSWRHVVSQDFISYLEGPAQRQRQAFMDRFGGAIAGDRSLADVPELMASFQMAYSMLIGEMVSEGASLLFGSDTAVGGFGWAAPPGLGGYWEMLDWRQAGVEMDMLFKSLTLDNARAFGLDAEIGSIEIGKRADILILEQNPLLAIEAYDSISIVIIGGEPVERAELSALRKDIDKLTP